VKLAVIPGDGIGPEVVAEALKVMRAAGEEHDITTFDLGAERYLRTGDTLTDADLDDLRAHEQILLGAVGDPRVAPSILERDLLLRLRFSLDLYVNLRPVVLFEGVTSALAGRAPTDIDMLVVRENSEGLYAGAGGSTAIGTPREVATQESLNTRSGVDRVLRYAFTQAAARPRKHLTLVHKTNVLTNAGGLWMRAFEETAGAYPEVTTSYVHVDAAALYMVTDPGRFDTVVTDNMFGDILTDLGAAISGGLGFAASGNLNPDGGPSVFEPVHGSAPDIANTGKANPVACILSVAMLLRHAGRNESADRIENAVRTVLRAGVGEASTQAIGDAVAAAI
jgi:3-isopropylmalate dehydrogenase